MSQKLNGRITLSKIPKELIQTASDGSRFCYVDIVPNRNGADQYGNTHSVSIYDKQKRERIYLGNLKPQDFGDGAQGGKSRGNDDLPWEK